MKVTRRLYDWLTDGYVLTSFEFVLKFICVALKMTHEFIENVTKILV